MFGSALELLRQFDHALVAQFQALRGQRGTDPVFLIEHGLDPEALAEMLHLVGTYARMEGLAPARWPNATLPLAVAITETGYGYRGTGTEFWPRLSRDLGVVISGADRLAVRALFERLSQRLGTPQPHRSDWARNYSNIAWPIRNALAPLEIHRPLAAALGKVAQMGGPGLDDDEFYRRLVGIAGGLWSGRLSDWLEDRTLAIALGRSLLTGEESAARLEFGALARIGRDIRMDAECRQVLRQARRVLRNPSRKPASMPPRATWLASVSVASKTGGDGRGIPVLDGLWLQGPKSDEAVAASQSALLTIAGQAQGRVFLRDFLQGAILALPDIGRAFEPALIHLSGRSDSAEDLLAALTPALPSVFRWAETGGLLAALGRNDVVHPGELVLQILQDRPDGPARPAGAQVLDCPNGILAWVAEASTCRIALTEAGVRLADSHLAEFACAGRIVRDGTRLMPPADTPLFLWAMCEGLQVSLGKPGATAASVGTVMALGDVAMLPASDGAIALHLQAGGQVSGLAETWEIAPYSDPSAAPRAFACDARPAQPSLADLRSGALVLSFASPVALGPVILQIGLSRNGAALARQDFALPGLPARLTFTAPELEELRAAAYQAAAYEEAWWTLTVTVPGLGEFTFPLPRRPQELDRVPGQIAWRADNAEDGGEDTAGVRAIIGPGLGARALAPLLSQDGANHPEAVDDIRLYLPDVPGLAALRAGLIEGKALLFGQSAQPAPLALARSVAPIGDKHGLATLCEALVAWKSAEASSFLVDARRTEIVRFLENSLLVALCGQDWLTAEAQDRRRPDSLARQMAEGAVSEGLALGPEFPQITPEDQPHLIDALTQRFANALASVNLSDRAPGPALTEDEAALLDAAVDAAYADLSASLELRGEPVLEESDAYSPADRWQRLSDRSWTQQAQSPFRHLILPESRWESLQATTYARLSDDDLVSLLTRCHMDISRTAGVDWVGPQVLRSGLLLWLAPTQLLETEAWRDHLARLLSDRHTARAIRYVALRLGRAERAAADRMMTHV